MADELARALFENGGPAFPSNSDEHRALGMTLRDYFAGQALSGLGADIGSAVMEGRARDVFPMVAGIAYAIADAILKARGNG